MKPNATGVVNPSHSNILIHGIKSVDSYDDHYYPSLILMVLSLISGLHMVFLNDQHLSKTINNQV